MILGVRLPKSYGRSILRLSLARSDNTPSASRSKSPSLTPRLAPQGEHDFAARTIGGYPHGVVKVLPDANVTW